VSVGLAVTGGGFRNRHVQECPDIGPACDSTTVHPYRHDLKIGTADLTLSAQWGFASGFALETVVPFRLNRQRIRFLTLEDQPFAPDPPDFHHANRTLSGFADPWLLVAAGTTRGAWSFGARAGASLPLGSTVPNPFALGLEGLAHEHVQLGSGSVQPIVALGVSRAFGTVDANATALLRLGAGTNRHGYRPGDQLLAQAFAGSALGVPHARFSLGPTYFHEGTETWDGRVESEGNLGRADLYAEARATWSPPGLGATLGGELRVPLWGRATGSQLDVPVSFRLSVSRLLGEAAP
jgi:hypothetical protein